MPTKRLSKVFVLIGAGFDSLSLTVYNKLESILQASLGTTTLIYQQYKIFFFVKINF